MAMDRKRLLHGAEMVLGKKSKRFSGTIPTGFRRVKKEFSLKEFLFGPKRYSYRE